MCVGVTHTHTHAHTSTKADYLSNIDKAERDAEAAASSLSVCAMP
jgi:hypothetical protein